MSTDKIKRYPRQLPPLGETTAANSVPVAIASDQFPLPITGTVISTPGPVEFVLNGSDTEVEQDTGTPANNVPLPVTLINGQGGSPYQGATQTTLAAVETALGDVDTNLEAIETILTSIDSDTGAIVTAIGDVDVNLEAIEGLLSSIDGDTGTINTNVADIKSALGDVDVNLEAIEASVASLDTKAVQEALNYGAATGAVRVAAQIGNASAVADFNAGTAGAQTLRVSANITRNGTELSYSSGNTDANTQRVILATDQPNVGVLTKNSIIPFAYDYFSVVYNSDNDVYTYKTGGSGGTTVATVTITYTSSAKVAILSAART